MYSVADYVWMIADETRVAAYAAAIRSLVRGGDHVLDVGAGFGFFSVIAARAGAARVDAVDINPAIHLGPRVARANGCADRIVFHHLDADRLALPRPADVIVSDLRGPTPFSGRSLQLLIDVRQRLLRPGGVMIPAIDTVFVAPSRIPDVVTREVHAAREREGVVLAPVERVLDDTPFRCAIDPADLIAPGQPWARIDYHALATADVTGSAEWNLAEDASVPGLATWFETDLGNAIGFSSAPGSPARAYRQIYIPFAHAVALSAGDRLRVQLSMKLVRKDYVWVWRAWVRSGSDDTEREVVNQNSLAEMVIDPSRLHQAGPAVLPPPGQIGRALQFMLARIDGRTSVNDLAAALRREYPAVLPDAASARDFIGEWMGRIADAERGTV